MFKFLARCQTMSSPTDASLEMISQKTRAYLHFRSLSVCGRKSRTIVGLSLWLYLLKKNLKRFSFLPYTAARVMLPPVSADVFF